MSNNTILRKYLDILSEDTSSKPADPSAIDAPSSDTSAPDEGKKVPIQSLAQKVVSTVTEFQKGIQAIAGQFPANAPERKVKPSGAIDPQTLVCLYAHYNQAGGAGKKVANDLKTPSDEGTADNTISENDGMMGGAAPAPMPAPMPITQEELEHKAELHIGYGHGLSGGSHHACEHEPGSKKHLHWHHGYAKGAKEYAECLSGMGVYKPAM